MIRLRVLPLALTALLAAPALAQQPATPNDPLQRMYDAPLKRYFGNEDPLKRYLPNQKPTPFEAKPPSVYPDNPLIPGGQPRAPRTFNQQAAPAARQPQLPPGMVTGAQPNGTQPTFDPRFRHLDANNDGQISRDEYLTSRMQRAPVNPSVRDLQAGSLQRRFDSRFGAADANRNGRIDRNEYDAATNPRF
jgi:hypothetical protein